MAHSVLDARNCTEWLNRTPLSHQATTAQTPLRRRDITALSAQSAESRRPEVGGESHVLIHVSEKASIAVEIVWPATSRGIGLPGSVTPFTVMVAVWQPTNRLGM